MVNKALATFFIFFMFGFSTLFADNNPAERVHVKFTGEIQAGGKYERAFGPGFRFILEPNKYGWTIMIKDGRNNKDISRLTPPFHSVPNPREIEGWHFRNIDNSGPNEAGEKNINAPGEVREFIFSPEVGKTIDGVEAKRRPAEEEIEAVRRFGRGKIGISAYRLADLEPGRQAKFEWMRFEVGLSWPAVY
ncbi:MAG: hypothetical protein NTX36_11875 [Proteobacteria bacterium]|nr:hypothetical protein [Pseudomonadota bacterium]